MKRKLRRVCTILLTLAICLTSTDMRVLAVENNVSTQLQTEITTNIDNSVSAGNMVSEGDSVSSGDSVTEDDSQDEIIIEDIYETEDFKVVFSLDESWENGYNANIKLENTGSSTIENWYLSFELDNTIFNIWDAQIYQQDSGKYVITNLGWNADIAVGESIEFGFTVNECFTDSPKAYSLLGETDVAEEEDYTIEYQLNSDWGNGFTGTIVITNNTDSIIEDWCLEFDFGRTITQIWNGVIEEQEDNHYVIKNVGHNANIQPGQTIIFGFMGELGETEMNPINYVLRQMKDGIPEVLTVTINQLDNMYVYEGIEGYLVVDKIAEFNGTVSLEDSKIKQVEVSVQSGRVSVPQNEAVVQNGVWKLSEPQMLIGDNLLTITIYSKSGAKAECSTHIWNTSEDNMNLLNVDRNDNDQDGLENYREEQYGTNPDSVDTDEDGFSDIDEIFLLDTDPLVFNNDEDYDQDGLFNKEELKINTNINSDDTDHDSLTDYDEVRVYGTDPKTPDTDKDKIKDFIEIKLGTNPCVAEQLAEDGTVRLEYKHPAEGAKVEATLNISLLPEQAESLEIEVVKADDAILSSEIPGYLGEGSAFDFTLDGTFAEATLTYKLNEELLVDEDFEPGIYYYNEETQLLEELENAVWNGDTISVKLEHFSRYVLLNKVEYGYVWNYNLIFAESGTSKSSLDIAFVIDSSGSMSSNDSSNIRKKVTNDFIAKLTDNDRAAVIDFDNTAQVYSAFTNNKEKLYNAVTRIDSWGGTDLSSGIAAALNLFSASNYDGSGKQKCIIMLTDGGGSYSTTYTTMAQEMEVTIYTIGLGHGVSSSVLTSIADGTGGLYFPASEAEKLYDIFDSLIELTDLYKDSDEDGISDYHEKAIESGDLRLGTGVRLIGLNFQDEDSDNDGILDGEELMIRQSGNRVYAAMNSNPTLKDTDNDGVSDKEELGTYLDDLGYYRVSSNPFKKEDFVIGDEGAVSFVLRYRMMKPIVTKKKYSDGTLPNGDTYTIYTFTDTTTIDFTKRKIVEVNKGILEKDYYVLYATVGNNVRGGQYDEVYRKAILVDNQLIIKGNLINILLNTATDLSENCDWVDGTSEDYLYYDCSKGDFLSSEEWRDVIHYEERFEYNCYYDMYLPITAFEASQMGFYKLAAGDSKYHHPDGMESEEEKGATYKYITDDGLEAIYETLYDGSVETISQAPDGTKMLPLQEYPNIGPTYNYSPNTIWNSDTGYIEYGKSKVTDASIAHYYFDMLPFYWWGGVPEE